MTKKNKMIKHKKHGCADVYKKHESSSSSSESCSDSLESDSDSSSYSDTESDSATSYSSLSEHCASDADSGISEISIDKDKRSRDFRKLNNIRTSRGKTRSNKKNAVIEFVSMTKEILKIWDKGGYISSDFLNKFVHTYKYLLTRKLELTRVDKTNLCSCGVEDATYFVALAFCMHYNASGENSEKWKIRFHGLVKNLISKNLITLEIVSCVFPLDASGNYYVDISSNKIIISGKVDTDTDKILYTDVSGSVILGPFKPTIANPLSKLLPGLKDIAIVLETERVLSTNMTLISNKLTDFIDKNMYND